MPLIDCVLFFGGGTAKVLALMASDGHHHHPNLVSFIVPRMFDAAFIILFGQMMWWRWGGKRPKHTHTVWRGIHREPKSEHIRRGPLREETRDSWTSLSGFFFFLRCCGFVFKLRISSASQSWCWSLRGGGALSLNHWFNPTIQQVTDTLYHQVRGWNSSEAGLHSVFTRVDWRYRL